MAMPAMAESHFQLKVYCSTGASGLAAPRYPRDAAVRSSLLSWTNTMVRRSALLAGFFIADQRDSFQRWMAKSCRLVARPVGRWQLRPNGRRICPTWPGCNIWLLAGLPLN